MSDTLKEIRLFAQCDPTYPYYPGWYVTMVCDGQERVIVTRTGHDDEPEPHRTPEEALDALSILLNRVVTREMAVRQGWGK